ncbi:unnamed protein product [Enterobius vermicularis]|uniref:Anoctamin n=1 Tax=Enterobius vermicularis TaxID=51028 RepID=A0A158QA47_ENTVE|nr:unnamed protein product [Enterobius vermicularis]
MDTLSPSNQLAMNYGDHVFQFIDETSSSACGETVHEHYTTFKDGVRRVDYVLAYETDESDNEETNASDNEDLAFYGPATEHEPKNARRRRIFEERLKIRGLELEYVDGKARFCLCLLSFLKFCEKTNFVLVHTPFDLLCKRAEKLGVEMPVRTDLRQPRTIVESPFDAFLKKLKWFSFESETEKYLETPRNQYHPFTKDDFECFMGSENPESFFSSADRIYVTHDLLNRTRFGSKDCVGIDIALKKGKDCSRREYFGSKIALYFLLYGYYTKFLIPCAVIGCLSFIYGFATVASDVPSNNICSNTSIGNTLMCPKCDHWCDYTLLKSSCAYSKVAYIFDNYSTLAFAILMSIGATFFVEGWKRYNADAAWKLGLLDTGSHEEGMRLAYLLQSLRSSDFRGRSDRNQSPTVIPLSERLPRVILTFFRGLTLKVPESKSRKFELKRRKRRKAMNASTTKVPQWEWDYALTPVYDQYLFAEYLDIVIQFGFVTLFVTAFPLAPLFALINSLLEIRVDAYNFVVAMRRPLPERAQNLGIWLTIIDKAFVIAFTSDFIPRLVYKYRHPTLEGFVNSTLSVFQVNENLNLPSWSYWGNVTECWFRDYRLPPCSLTSSTGDCDDNYGVTNMWWIVLAFRLGFVIIFAHVILAIKGLVSYIIPDMPSRVFIQMQRQRSFSIGGNSLGTNGVV